MTEMAAAFTHMSLAEVEDAIAGLCERNGWGWGIKLGTADLCAWDCEVRVTLAEREGLDTPERQQVTRAAGHARAEDAARVAYLGLLAWLDEEGKFYGDR